MVESELCSHDIVLIVGQFRRLDAGRSQFGARVAVGIGQTDGNGDGSFGRNGLGLVEVNGHAVNRCRCERLVESLGEFYHSCPVCAAIIAVKA